MVKANYVDIVIFVILIVDLLIGMKNGVILLLFDILSLVFGWILARAFAIKLAMYISSHFSVSERIMQWVTGIVKFPAGTENLPSTLGNVNDTLLSMNIPSFLKNFILNNFSETSQNVASFIAQKITSWVLIALSFVGIFLVVLVTIRIIGLIVRKAMKTSPFLHWVDVVFGGVVKVFLSIFVISIVLQAIVYIFNFFKIPQNTFLGIVLSSRFYLISSQIFPFIVGQIIKIFTGIM